jgi:hypothetical protein
MTDVRFLGFLWVVSLGGFFGWFLLGGLLVVRLVVCPIPRSIFPSNPPRPFGGIRRLSSSQSSTRSLTELTEEMVYFVRW